MEPTFWFAIDASAMDEFGVEVEGLLLGLKPSDIQGLLSMRESLKKLRAEEPRTWSITLADYCHAYWVSETLDEDKPSPFGSLWGTLGDVIDEATSDWTQLTEFFIGPALKTLMLHNMERTDIEIRSNGIEMRGYLQHSYRELAADFISWDLVEEAVSPRKDCA